MCNDCDYDYTTQFPDNCLETVEIILTSNGWYSFRDVQIDHYVPQIERMGFTIHDSAYKFLRSFYGIGIPFLSSWRRLFLVNDTILTQVPLHEYFIGIGVLPTYYSYTIDKHSYTVCHTAEEVWRAIEAMIQQSFLLAEYLCVILRQSYPCGKNML